MKIGFIGLGNVGGKLANSLLRNGINLIVRDKNIDLMKNFQANGASISNSPKELSQKSDIIITCLPSPSICAEVMESADGVINGITKNKIWLEMSTTDSSEIIRIGNLLTKKGAFSLDAPVSGGCHRAETGNISIFVGGRRESFDKAFKVLSILGKDIIYTGPLGSASILKVITNFLASTHLVAIGEALMVAKKSGIDLDIAFKAIKSSSGNSFVHETESQLILNGSYAIDFTMDLVLKDINLFNDLSKQNNISLDLSPLVIKVFEDGRKRYGEKSWSTMIVKRLEDRYATNLRAKGYPDKLVDNQSEIKGKEI